MELLLIGVFLFAGLFLAFRGARRNRERKEERRHQELIEATRDRRG